MEKESMKYHVSVLGQLIARVLASGKLPAETPYGDDLVADHGGDTRISALDHPDAVRETIDEMTIVDGGNSPVLPTLPKVVFWVNGCEYRFVFTRKALSTAFVLVHRGEAKRMKETLKVYGLKLIHAKPYVCSRTAKKDCIPWVILADPAEKNDNSAKTELTGEE